MGPVCIDLKKNFGDRYCIEHEEGARHDGPSPWLQIIPGRHGHIGPWDDGRILACTDRVGSIPKRLKRLPGSEVWQDGSDGANIIFPVEMLDQVAALLGSRRRRRLSPEARAAARERLAKIRPPTPGREQFEDVPLLSTFG